MSSVNVDKLWQLIKTRGQAERGVSDNDLVDFPEWVDRERFARAQEHVKNHRAGLGFASLCGLMFVVQLPRGLVPLLYTKKSESVCSLFTRYLDTILHLKLWYEEDLFDKESKGYKSIVRVRSMHKHIYKMMNLAAAEKNINANNNENSSTDARVWVSQYDMTVTQWAFIGLIVLHPEKCGLHNPTPEDIDAIIYLWRVFGYFIGIKDEYNMCLDDVDATKKLCSLIYDEVFFPVLSAKDPPAPQGVEMAKDIIKSLRPLHGKLSGDIFNKYWYEYLGIREVPLTSVMDMFGYYMIRLYNEVLFYYIKPFYRYHGNRMYQRVGNLESKAAEIVEKMPEEDKAVKYFFHSDLM